MKEFLKEVGEAFIIPNMKAYVKAGNRFARAPIDYDHNGPRVRNGKFLSQKQKILINETGELLKEAWQWKVSSNYSDAQLLLSKPSSNPCFPLRVFSNFAVAVLQCYW